MEKDKDYSIKDCDGKQVTYRYRVKKSKKFVQIVCLVVLSVFLRNTQE